MPGQQIPNGAVATILCKLSFPQGFGFSLPNDIIAKIGAELVFDGLTIGTSDVSTLSALGALFSAQFEATLQIVNQSGQELDESDLLAQFNDAVSTVGGTVITAGLLQVTGNDSGTNAATASHGAVTPQTTPLGVLNAPPSSGGAKKVLACGDPSWGFFDDPAQWLTCLTSKGLSTVGLLAIGLIIGIILIVGIERRPTPV